MWKIKKFKFLIIFIIIISLFVSCSIIKHTNEKDKLNAVSEVKKLKKLTKEKRYTYDGEFDPEIFKFWKVDSTVQDQYGFILQCRINISTNMSTKIPIKCVVLILEPVSKSTDFGLLGYTYKDERDDTIY
jgi:hypothetical protein